MFFLLLPPDGLVKPGGDEFLDLSSRPEAPVPCAYGLRECPRFCVLFGVLPALAAWFPMLPLDRLFNMSWNKAVVDWAGEWARSSWPRSGDLTRYYINRSQTDTLILSIIVRDSIIYIGEEILNKFFSP